MACGHTVAVHSMAGNCLLAQIKKNPSFKALHLAQAPGWIKCPCKQFLLEQRTKTESSVAPELPAPIPELPAPIIVDDEDTEVDL